jgi:ABC-type polar amino acid transport system ATPase subunit
MRGSARTFMRSLVSDLTVGLLLFDEPSAALDPLAEHGAWFYKDTLDDAQTGL